MQDLPSSALLSTSRLRRWASQSPSFRAERIDYLYLIHQDPPGKNWGHWGELVSSVHEEPAHRDVFVLEKNKHQARLWLVTNRMNQDFEHVRIAELYASIPRSTWNVLEGHVGDSFQSRLRNSKSNEKGRWGKQLSVIERLLGQELAVLLNTVRHASNLQDVLTRWKACHAELLWVFYQLMYQSTNTIQIGNESYPTGVVAVTSILAGPNVNVWGKNG